VVSAGIADRGATVLYVRSSSDVRNAGELRGKRIAVSSTQGSSTVLLQYVLHKKYGLNSALTGGDVTYVVEPPDTTPELLGQGRVDAAVELNEPAYQLRQAGGFRIADNLTNDARGLVGAYPLQTVLVTYPAVEKSMRPALTELLAAIRASVAYARSMSSKSQPRYQQARRTSRGTSRTGGQPAHCATGT
jgi:NitT/TauT family transport system substrate-binding protein